ncbi:hypothetical protein CYLTODRAFT_453115 [Cylindrobasidium torrendii FP15055 ss-10]|uniref:Uncharacterized protein n=1 Tax=Cylindrobasidium torrendii FP15055 ss-10 TaxID=1314674 RepID=A0A0D7BEA8_9AGAR|nr:hypothetical protein CYLTODRAFT_453115 [Cylindrobasidium torrendii FP15055 ss-10]
MRERCNNFVFGLENAEYDPDAPLVQGLRPFLGSNVRVERVLRQRADGKTSNYRDVLDLVQEIEDGVAPMKMSRIMKAKAETQAQAAPVA